VGGSDAQAMYNVAVMNAVNEEVAAAQQRVSSSQRLAFALPFLPSSPALPCLSFSLAFAFPSPPALLCLSLSDLFPCLCLPHLPCLALPFNHTMHACSCAGMHMLHASVTLAW